MNKDKLLKKLEIAFTKNLGVDINSGFKDDIDAFNEKVILLDTTGRYNELVKRLLSSRNRIEFNSYAFETYFAYDFELKGKPLKYETKLLESSDDKVDFLYKTDGINLCFDLHQANQRTWLTDLTKAQLSKYGGYEFTWDAHNQLKKIIRLQEIILSKCQDKNGSPRKFPRCVNVYNFIVIYVSGEIDGHIIESDCKLTMYGDYHHPLGTRLNIFGLCQYMSESLSDKFQGFYEKFKHFRETIHGVLFVKNISQPNSYGNLILDLNLEYFPIRNRDLIDKHNFNIICNELFEALKPWSK